MITIFSTARIIIKNINHHVNFLKKESNKFLATSLDDLYSNIKFENLLINDKDAGIDSNTNNFLILIALDALTD
ncbi:MAG: hypothetical protein DSZ21_00850 [Tenericutes bacterium]|nr:MAG: hypothetical protein DSZ21_00850 [Mycoplasmatota bacterium]